MAPAGTTAVILVAETTVNELASTPLNITEVIPVKFLPVMVTVFPMRADPGLKELIDGLEYLIDKLELEEVVPNPLVTETVPEVAPAGTTAVILVDEATMKEAASRPLNFTAVAPLKFVPVSVMVAPGAALVGLSFVIVG